ncbi:MULTISPECIES: hypothetical protein [unclassified Sporosarcina]|uniref:hypothetical protein n=1 Tax=unclassified Sporosarcina TaxID=2647733 RepID=UPI00203B31BA|nr:MULTISPECIES: hypothetical protein [unclassified Sporosarcina]GKV65477.1 hypothetical protein NCCP2331_16300 [Sporosarcina sp. NCCP-2331]GLB55601.1 hypothetical protein NCCP2378_13880 [Sporosarcina sp. NCCP-2378]
MDRKILDFLRSSTEGPEEIKVVYLGKAGNFNYGIVQIAKARYVTKTCKPYPNPKRKYSVYRVEDSDGDAFPISDDGSTFYNGFYPVPEHLTVGSDIADITNYRDWRKSDEY